MPPRDPETRFEQVLARHLRRGSSKMEVAEGAAQTGCLDPETLAAYHESALIPAEMAACREHVAACARCQEVLEALEASEAVAVQAEAGVLAAAAAPTPAVAETPRANRRTEGVRRTWVRPKRLLLWQWLVPAAAVAAGIVIWIGVRETRQPAQAPVQVAMNTAPSKALEAVSPAPTAQPQAALKGAGPARGAEPGAKAEGRTLGGFIAKPQAASRAVPREESASALSRVAAPRPAENGAQAYFGNAAPQSVLSKASEGQPASTRLAPAARPPAKSDVTVETEKQEDKKLAATAALADTDTVDGARTRSDDRANQIADQEKAKHRAEANVAVNGREMVALDALKENHPGLQAAGSGTRNASWEIAAPGGRVLWRVDGGGIQKSSDGGATWTGQPSGVTAQLLAGAASNEQVCWLVGRNGTVLRTTDGEHWTKIEFPWHVDLGSVTAHDELHAVVWDDQWMLKYVTSDGGKTWTRVSGNE